jgi:hypothetical protein
MPGFFTFATFSAVSRPTRCAISASLSYPQRYPHPPRIYPRFRVDLRGREHASNAKNMAYFSVGWETVANNCEHRRGGEGGILRAGPLGLENRSKNSVSGQPRRVVCTASLYRTWRPGSSGFGLMVNAFHQTRSLVAGILVSREVRKPVGRFGDQKLCCR